MLGDVPVLGRQGALLARPAYEAPAHRVGLEARGAKGLGGHLRARADAAVEDDRPIALQRGSFARELDQLDVPGARDVPGVATVGLAHVDDLQARVLLEPPREALWIDLEPGSLIAGLHACMSLASA